jgi:hypothetical protein
VGPHRGDDLLDADAQAIRFGERRGDHVIDEPRSPLGEKAFGRTRGDEHPDAATFLEHALVDQFLKGLRCGRRVDPVEDRVLIRRHHLISSLQCAREDLIPDLHRDLHIDR